MHEGVKLQQFFDEQATQREMEKLANFLKQGISKVGEYISSGGKVNPFKSQLEEMNGFLYKQGPTKYNVVAIWRKRYFRLHADRLNYYKTEQDSTPCGVIPLTDIVAKRATEHPEAFVFQVSTAYRNFVIKGINDKEVDDWIKAINEVAETISLFSSPSATDPAQHGSAPTPAPVSTSAVGSAVPETVSLDSDQTSARPASVSTNGKPKQSIEFLSLRGNRCPSPTFSQLPKSAKPMSNRASMVIQRPSVTSETQSHFSDDYEQFQFSTTSNQQNKTACPLSESPDWKGARMTHLRTENRKLNLTSRAESPAPLVPPPSHSTPAVPAERSGAGEASPESTTEKMRRPVPSRGAKQKGSPFQPELQILAKVQKLPQSDQLQSAKHPAQSGTTSDPNLGNGNGTENENGRGGRGRGVRGRGSTSPNLRPNSLSASSGPSTDSSVTVEALPSHSLPAEEIRKNNGATDKQPLGDSPSVAAPRRATGASRPNAINPLSSNQNLPSSPEPLAAGNRSSWSNAQVKLKREANPSPRQPTETASRVTKVRHSIRFGENRDDNVIKELKAGFLNSLESPSTSFVRRWVTLTPIALSIYKSEKTCDGYELVRSVDVPLCIVRTRDERFSFEVKQENLIEPCIFQAVDEDSKKDWMLQIKQAKHLYYKTFGSDAIPSQPSSGSFRSSLILGPGRVAKDKEAALPEELLKDGAPISFQGYLFRYDEKKNSSRLWFSLRENFLFQMKGEKVPTPILASICLEGVNTRFFSSPDDLTFQIITKAETISLEGSSQPEVLSWITQINKARLKQSTSTTDSLVTPAKNQSLSKKAYLYCEEQYDRRSRSGNFWFVLNGSLLHYFQDDSESSLLGELLISNCYVRDVQGSNVENSERWFEIVGNNSFEHVFLQAPSLEKKKEWISLLKQSKLQFWSGKTSQEVQKDGRIRGFLMKKGKRGNIWRRRWFFISDTILLYFKTQKDATPIGEVDLSDANIKMSEATDSTLKFELECSHRTFYLEASSQEELDRWFQVIEQIQLLARLHNKQPSQKSSKDPETETSDTAQVVNEKFEKALRKPDKEGFLMKQGAGFKTWKRRWFILKHLQLFYFASSQITPGEHCGIIELADAQVELPIEKDNLLFQIVTRHRIYFIKADKEEDMISWAESINYNKQLGSQERFDEVPLSKTHSSPLKKGILTKKGKHHKIWKKRYFELQSNTLRYYRSEGPEETPAGTISLDGCKITMADELLRRKFTFEVSTPHRSYFLQASDPFELASWVESIKYFSNPKYAEEIGISPEDIEDGLRLFGDLNLILSSHEKFSSSSS